MLFQRSPQPETPPEELPAPVTILPIAVFQQLERLYSSTQTAPEVVELLLQYSAENSVSDILLEPIDHGCLVRVRLDGVLHEATRMPQEVYGAVIARVKVLAGLDSGNLHQITQEGKFVLKLDGSPITVRIAIAQVAGGELAALRIHDSGSMSVSLRDHGMSDSIHESYLKQLKFKSGLVIVCGPTGAGKTSTLYSSLQLLNDGKSNIIAIEDPVEYILPGINQMEVDNERGLSFAQGLRVTLRLNPDIIFVGEIRDQETARIGVESSLTGHLVLTTLHANSALSAISRLRDLEIERFFIAAALKGVLCQRLIRQTCKTCGVWSPPHPDEAAAYLQVTGAILEQQFSGPGCEECSHTGFKGRVGIFELITVNDAVREIISNLTMTEADMLQALRKNGYRTLLEDGLHKVLEGATTVVEVITHAYSGD